MKKLVVAGTTMIVGLGVAAITKRTIEQRRVKRFGQYVSELACNYIREYYANDNIEQEDDSEILEFSVPVDMEDTEKGEKVTIVTPIQVSIGMTKRILNGEYVEVEIVTK